MTTSFQFIGFERPSAAQLYWCLKCDSVVRVPLPYAVYADTVHPHLSAPSGRNRAA